MRNGDRRRLPPVEIVAVIVSGLVVGALARLALPGPDPIPIWATILLGIAGGVVGVGVGLPVGGPAAAFPVSLVAATLLLLGYRRLVQKRPITGPEARRPLGEPAAARPEDAAVRLRRLEELRDQGLISEREFELKREELASR
jgi:uncharacterized membrane protein YeaQ/YmgE (transglycosylase-associated protein family)